MLALAAESHSRSNLLTVSEQIYLGANNQSSTCNNCLKSAFRAAYFLFSSEIAHTTNWRPFVFTFAACDDSKNLQTFFEKSPAHASHLSTTAITDILDAYSDAMGRDIRNRLEHINEFSVMADECTNFNGGKMTSVCVRILTVGKVVEVFLGCYPLTSTKAVDMHACIVECLAKFNLNPANIVAVSFDGASNMSGQHAGIQALLKKQAPDLIFIHCRSHMLQLAMVKASNNIPHIKRVIGV